MKENISMTGELLNGKTIFETLHGSKKIDKTQLSMTQENYKMVFH